jgi:hypothetical protein
MVFYGDEGCMKREKFQIYVDVNRQLSAMLTNRDTKLLLSSPTLSFPLSSSYAST